MAVVALLALGMKQFANILLPIPIGPRFSPSKLALQYILGSHLSNKEIRRNRRKGDYNFDLVALSTLCPSSACSATVKSGNLAGMMRRGLAPGTTLYFAKSVTPQWSRKKSSSRTSSPLTFAAGERRMPRMASEKMVGLRRSFSSPGFFLVNCSVAADSIAWGCVC